MRQLFALLYYLLFQTTNTSSFRFGASTNLGSLVQATNYVYRTNVLKNIPIVSGLCLFEQTLQHVLYYAHQPLILIIYLKVICPGFCNDEVDYLKFVSALTRRGFDSNLIQVLPLQRYEWIRVAGGLFDIPNFYTGNCRPDGLGYGWYVKRLRKTIEETYDKAGRDEKVLIIGHSAGKYVIIVHMLSIIYIYILFCYDLKYFRGLAG